MANLLLEPLGERLVAVEQRGRHAGVDAEERHRDRGGQRRGGARIALPHHAVALAPDDHGDRRQVAAGEQALGLVEPLDQREQERAGGHADHGVRLRRPLERLVGRGVVPLLDGAHHLVHRVDDTTDRTAVVGWRS